MSRAEKCHRCGGSGKEPNNLDIGKRARKERILLGLSLREAAAEIDTNQSYICDLELGRRPWQGPKARRYLEALGISQGGTP